MSVTHRFVSPVPNDADPDTVGPDEWNDTHEIKGNFLLSEKASADTPDDEFPITTLDAQWAVVNGSSGTVDMVRSTSQNVYDLTSRPGWLLMQGTVSLRQDFTLPDGASIVLAAAGTPANAGDNMTIYVGINDNDTAHSSGNTCYFGMEQDTGSWDSQQIVGGTVTGGGTLNIEGSPGQVMFFRLCRVGSIYIAFTSYDGTSWAYVGQTGGSTTGDNLWIHTSAPTSYARLPVVAVAWIRQGTNDFDPWPWW